LCPNVLLCRPGRIRNFWAVVLEPQLSPQLGPGGGPQSPIQRLLFPGDFEAGRVSVEVCAPPRGTAGGVERSPACRVADDPDQVPLPRLLPARDAGAGPHPSGTLRVRAALPTRGEVITARVRHR